METTAAAADIGPAILIIDVSPNSHNAIHHSATPRRSRKPENVFL